MISDAAARSAALDPRRSFIVQAPAGSGKTELLTQRYLRLLATVESPEQILAITFTRKAAAEMRARILQALQSADAQPPESAHKRSTWELARAVRAIDAQRGWQLMQHPARLRIQTIDALNASLARRLPVIAGTGAALEPTTDMAPLYELAGRRLLERLGDGSPVAAHLEVLVMHLGNRVERLIQLLNDLLAKRDQWLHIVMHARASTDLRATLQATLTRLVENHLQALCEALGKERCEVLLQLRRYSARNLLAEERTSAAMRAVLEQCAEHPSPLLPVSTALPVWREIAAMLFKKDRNKDELYESVSVRQGFPPTNKDIKARMLEMLRALSSDQRLSEDLATLRTLPDPVYSDDQWRMLEALLELLPAAAAELQVVFQAQGKADYVEIALRALRALGTPEEPTDLALAFDYRLQHILVDEFQDTSFSQLDLLERLTGGWADGDGRTLFCVGDPMQSIYRFRQAEVGLFIDLQQHGLRNLRLEPLRLAANFRSTPAIVQWVNDSFPAVLAARNDAEQGAVQYSPSTATVADTGGGVHVHTFVNADEDIEAGRVVSIVRDSLEQSAEGRTAILVAARTHVDAIARELTAAGVDFQAIEIEQLRDRPVVQDLIALTRALVHVADRTAWFAVLRAPWCGLTLADLHSLAGQAGTTIEAAIPRALSSTHDDLFSEGRLSDDGRVRLARTWQILSAALNERGRWPLRIWVERTWNALGGPATLTRVDDLDDAESYLARLEQIENVADLDDVARIEEQLFRLFANARFAGAARVEVMTIHAAKGLEFDTVIVPGLQRYLPNYNRELLRWTRVAGPQGGMVLAPVKPDGGDPDPIYRWIELLERRRVARERARLLYVAVTRAKRDLHILGNATAKERDGRLILDEPRRGSMLRMLWGAVETMFWDTEPSAPIPAGYKPAPPQKLRRLPLDWRPARAQLVTQAPIAEVIDIEDEERPVFDWVSQVSRHVGTLVHRELDRLCRPGMQTSPENLHSARARLMAELAELGVPPDRCAAACERVIAAMERTLADERGRWLLGIDGRIREAASELALSGVVEGQILEGVIDRTFLDESGQRWIVDFKTSTHEGGGLDAFLDEEVVRYRPQLERYARLMRAYRPGEHVRAALYFPVLRQWREVPVAG
ncbi:MAG TPA: UvrD-helicase domain-containing protein [Steroidobacteraceae bacterium]|nr:UvrD-helicase domain-containing protein [Steroidobacteraceae bacterium]